MTIFQYALLRAARQMMTAEEIEVATELGKKAEAGMPGAERLLGLMINDILFDGRGTAAPPKRRESGLL
jgi:hypothetical protein